LGVVKYFQKQSDGVSKFLYDNDYEMIQDWVKTYKIEMKTIDCEIMDISDEIAYSAHDLEDALKLKYFTIDELLYEFSISEEYKEVTTEFKKIIVKAKKFAEKSYLYKSSEEYSMLFRKELTSILVSRFILDVDLTSENKIGYLKLGKLIKGLKKLTFKAIKRQPDIIEYEQFGKHILTKLFELYSDENFNKELILLPANDRNITKKDTRILDYLGGMTDIYAIQQYEKYFGTIKDAPIYYKSDK
jgi:dGTPase